jgi:hypothetical protein
MAQWRYPEEPKGETESYACPTGAEPASRVAGAGCPITLDALLLLCSPANFLRWVRRIFTYSEWPKVAGAVIQAG